MQSPRRTTASNNDERRDSALRLSFASQIIDKTPDMIFTLSLDGFRITYANEMASRVSGYTREEISKLRVHEINPGVTEATYAGFFAPLISREKQHVVFETTHRRKDGTAFPVEIRAQLLEIEDTPCILNVVRDISERRSEEKTRLGLLARLEQTESVARVGGFEIDVITGNRSATPGLLALLDIEPKSEKAYKDYSERHNEDLGIAVGHPLALAVMKSKLDGVPVNTIGEIPTAKGRKIWVQCRFVPVVEDGKTVCIRGYIQDITDQRVAEQAKADFVATVSHELRTPLTCIKGSLDLLEDGVAGQLNESVQELVHMARSNADVLVTLVNDILDIEKIEAGQMTINRAPLNLSAVVQDSVAGMNAYANQLSVNLIIESILPEANILGDRGRLIQVLNNLLSNASKFSPAGSTVKVSLVESGDNFRVSVSDQGSGIAKEFQNKIFQRFSQARDSSHRHIKGTGLGLSIAKALILAHGGDIAFETEVGKGTIFFFDLPKAP